MRFTHISEIQELSDGTVIEGLKGTVTKIGKTYSGIHDEYGPWTLQTITLTDDGKLSVNCVFMTRDDATPLKGKFICLISGKDKKGKVSGLTVNDEEYNGKVTRKIKVNGLAEITETIPASQLQQPVPKEQPVDQLAETAAQKLLRERKEAAARGEPLPTTAQPHAGNVAKGINRLGQRAHLMFLCRKAAFAIAAECNRIDKLNTCEETSINSMTVTMFISAEREGLDKDLSSNFLKPDAAPKPKPQAPPPPPPVEEEDNVPF